MRDLLIWLFGTESSFGRQSRSAASVTPIRPACASLPVVPDASLESGADALLPLKNWSHPFKNKDPLKDTRNPLSQLTHLAKAKAGYFPLGRSGLFHGGVHFDSGTAAALDQSSVHCLADGEVVAYRIDTQAPTTAYSINKQTVEKPFSRNFVLVRHHLQPPKIKGCPDTPPGLTFYSLYMHLQDWSVYREDTTLTRPAFWPESPILRVKQTVNDFRPEQPELRGLNMRTKDWQGKVIDLLPRGTEVTVSGERNMRKLENSLGPAKLISADGSLRGYVSITEVKLIAGDAYYVKTRSGSLNVYAEPDFHSEVLMELPVGTHLTLSGDDYYRKLERIDQYVHFASLQGEQKPLALDRVVALDTPIAIKAGELIGHLGKYQDSGAQQPEEKLHLEVFSGDDVEVFIKASRAWARRLPEQANTWLKLATGTAVVPHQEHVTAAQLKILSAASPLSATDLLIPKSVLDELPADRKIQVTASGSHKASNWYRLEGLLHDADHNLLNGWVREEVGVTPWVSPWSWEGYAIIDEYDVPQEFMASFLRAVKRLSEAQLERFGPMADEGDTGPLKTRLYDIIDANRDGRMTAEELRAAISRPAHAQSISQLIVHCESEWYHKPGKWDRLDEVLGHSGSTPHLNWLAEKRRIKQMCWWGEVAAKVGLPAHGEVYHFHPVGLLGHFTDTNGILICKKCSGRINLTKAFLEEICGKDVPLSFLNAMVETSASMFNKYGVDSCAQMTHLLAQAKKETGGFLSFRESLNYSRKTYSAIRLYRLAPTAINAGFARKGISFSNDSEKLQWIDENLIGNDAGYGEHCFGSGEQPGKDFRGRGLIHLTHYETYKKCASDIGLPIHLNPELLESNFTVAIETALWFWKTKKIAAVAETSYSSEDDAVTAVTRPINVGLAGLTDRQKYKREITKVFVDHFNSRCLGND